MRRWLPSLDGLRALAIVPIVWHHATPHQLEGVLGRGPLGVDLFFAISGFLITTLLLDEAQAGGISLTRFWARRSLRIFPLYYFVLGAFIVHALLYREHGPARDDFLSGIPYFATYTSNFLRVPVPHAIVFAFAWSLAAEEQFYLVWPLVLRVLRGRLRPAIAIGIVIALDQAFELAGHGLTPLGLGCVLALARPTFPRWASLAALAFVVFAVVRPLPLLPTQIALALLVGSCTNPHWLAPLFENRAVRWIGTVSYGMYLLNVPLVWAAKSITSNTGVVFLVSLASTIAFATITHYAIEKPFLRLRSRFSPSGRRIVLEELAPNVLAGE